VISNKRCLLLFARSPERGRVKTRLMPALGEERTLRLYESLLYRQLNLVNNYVDTDAILAVHGEPDHPVFSGFRGTTILQKGDDIGQRMSHAMEIALTDYKQVLLAGCDCPAMNAEYLDAGFQALDQGKNAVFGPVRDGGYVLVGLSAALPEIFINIDWGSDKVMSQTREKLHALKVPWKELPVTDDIDDPQDLALLEAFPDISY